MEDKNYIVYIHRNKTNNKCYVGITCQTANQRWHGGSNYIQKKADGSYSQPKFARAIKKYGWDGFEHIIWAEGLTKEKACRVEQLLIAMWDTIKNGYNIRSGGETNSTFQEESKRKMSESMKKRWEDEDYRKRTSEAHLGHELSEEHKQKLIAANTNRKMSQYTKDRLNESKYKKVAQYTKDGQLIKIWNSITEAADALGINMKGISNVCRHPERYKTAGGFVWKYFEEVKEAA